MTSDNHTSSALDEIWASPANAPQSHRTQEQMEALMTRLEKEKRWVNRVTTVAGLVLSLFTLRILYDVIATPGVFDMTREWATFALLVLPWIALFVVRQRMLRANSPDVDDSATVSDMLRGALRDNAAARWRIGFLGLALAAGVALTAIALLQLIDTGKMTERNAAQGALLFGGTIAAVGVYMLLHYLLVLRPEAQRLARLLADGEPD